MNRKELIESMGLEYSAEFVPFSKSRNAKKAAKPSDLSLNWFVTIKKGNQTLRQDYMQGIGHMPGYKQSWHGRVSNDDWRMMGHACETGNTYTSPRTIFSKPIPAPSFEEVLYSLVMDAGAIDYPSFEDWAVDYGYNQDSREGEKIYRQCVEIGLKLRAMIGDKGLTNLRDAFQDY